MHLFLGGGFVLVMSISEAIWYSYWTFFVMAFFGAIIGAVIVAALDAQRSTDKKLAEQH